MKRANGWMGLAVAAGLSLGCVAATWADTEVVGGVTWSYSLDGGNATVTGAFPAEGALSIPSSLDNCSVTSIGNYAFSGCIGLMSVTIPDSVTNIGKSAFFGCNGLASVTIPDGVTSIGEWAFSGCSGLTNVTIPDNMTDIGEYAFSGCSGLTSVRIPDGVKNIASKAFDKCSALTDVTVLGNVTNDWSYSWRNDDFISLGPFSECTNLSRVVLSDKMTKIGDCMFFACSGLTSLVMSDNVRSIGDNAFYHCSSLISMDIGNSVTNIGYCAFGDCAGLVSVSIGNGVMNIGDFAFVRCYNLKAFDVLTSNEHYKCETGVIFSKDGSILVAYPCGKSGDFIIPDIVTDIGNAAFAFSGLTSISNTDGVKKIGECAFMCCSNLVSMTLSDTVTDILSAAFSGCSNLKEMHVPKAWESKYVNGKFWSSYAIVPSGCTIIYYETETSGVPVAVPYRWLETNAVEILAAHDGDYEEAAKAEAANGMPVWECYLAGLSPTNAVAEFKVKSISFKENGAVVVEWDPDLNEGKTKQERLYELEGAETLGGAWGPTNAASRFFRVKVALP